MRVERLSCRRPGGRTLTGDTRREGRCTVDWATAAVIIAIVFALMVIGTTYLSTHTKEK